MVRISDTPKAVSNALDSVTRKKILLLLFDDEKRSAYSVKNDLNLKISLSSVIEHLQKLEKADLIKSENANKGKRIRYHYKITNKGKKYLNEEYKFWAKEAPKEIKESILRFLGRP